MAALKNDSNLASRISCIAFGALGYTSSALLAAREARAPKSRKTAALTLGVITLLCTWTFPYHRVFDTVASCWTFNIAHHQITRGNRKSHILSGICCGLLFFLGRNHGLYGLIAATFAVVVYYISRKKGVLQVLVAVFLMSASLTVTATAMFLIQEEFRPGSAIESVRQWVAFGSSGKTNLSAPLPLPWRNIKEGMSASQVEGHLLAGILVLVVILVAVAGSLLILRKAFRGRTVDPVAGATIAGTVGYLHCMTSRPDLIHIANPLIVIVMGIYCMLLRERGGIYVRIAALFAVYATVRTALREQVSYQCITKPASCGEIQMDALHTVSAKETIARETSFVEDWVRGKKFLALPGYSSIYARAGVPAPKWGMYASLAKSVQVQEQILQTIDKEDYSIIVLKRSNGGTDPSKTMPLAFNKIAKEYVVAASHKELSVEIYKKRADASR